MIDASQTDALVLSTVNAPYRRAIDAESLTSCLRTGGMSDWIVHLATFFVDVRPGLVLRFADQHGVDIERLSRTYHELKAATGERSPAFEAALDVASASGSDLRGPRPGL